MQEILGAIVYLSLFRVAMVCAGIVCITLGYRLIAAAIQSAQGRQPAGVEVGAEFMSMKIKASNLTPGTLFALLGVILIGLQFTGIGPKAVFEFAEGKPDRVNLRGSASNVMNDMLWITNLSDKALDELSRDPNKAVLMAREALGRLAPTLNDLAWVLSTGSQDQGLAYNLALLAVESVREEKEFFHTLATICERGGRLDESIAAWRRFLELLPLDDPQRAEVEQKLANLTVQKR